MNPEVVNDHYQRDLWVRVFLSSFTDFDMDAVASAAQADIAVAAYRKMFPA